MIERLTAALFVAAVGLALGLAGAPAAAETARAIRPGEFRSGRASIERETSTTT